MEDAMRKISVIVGLSILGIFFISCAPKVNFIESSTVTAGFDFRPYTAKGFLITPYQHLGEYESIGMLSVTIWAEGMRNIEDKFVFKPLDTRDAIDSLYMVAVEMGADALVSFEVTSVTADWPSGGTVIKQPGIRASGYAILRQD
jgi:hypothetical protein